MRQGNDRGTEYRSRSSSTTTTSGASPRPAGTCYQKQLSAAGYGTITTEIVGPPAPPFYFAEDYHQQYLDKDPVRLLPEPFDRREAARRLRRDAVAVRRLTTTRARNSTARGVGP
jgi:peptide methionine sulfoxide reductase MsrA